MPDQIQILTDIDIQHRQILQKHHHKHIPRSQRYSDCKIRAIPITCRSVWCEHCRKTSETNIKIQHYARQLKWEYTRHIILTLSRTWPADKTFDKIKESSRLFDFTQCLKKETKEYGLKYIWILEFHADSYAHWHFLIEISKKHTMIGKKLIERLWPFGLVWETYPRDEKHWKALIGYHHKKGYLASEDKKHQLTLPQYLQNRSRTRKFGTNIHDPNTQSTQTQPEILKPKSKRRKYERKQKTTAESMQDCLKYSYIEIESSYGVHSFTTKIPINEIQDIILMYNGDQNDFHNFNINRKDAIDFYIYLQKIDSKRSVHLEA